MKNDASLVEIRASRRSPLIWTARFAAPTVLVILISVLLFNRSPKADAYYPSGITWTPGAAVVMSLQLGTHNQVMPLSDGSANFDVVAQQAADIWNSYLASEVRIFARPEGTAPGVPGDIMSSVFFSDTYFDVAFAPSVLAETAIYYNSVTNHFYENDIVFNTANYKWDSYRGPIRTSLARDSVPNLVVTDPPGPPITIIPTPTPTITWDLKRVAIHEMGHALGLDHPDQHGQNVVAIMNSSSGAAGPEAPQMDDISGLQSLYGVPSPTPTPTPTPAPIATGGQTLSAAIAHVYSSRGEPLGGGTEATIDATTTYPSADYRRDVEPVTNRVLHRFIFARNGVAGTGEWVFTFATQPGQNFLTDGLDTASVIVRFESNYSNAVSEQVILQNVTYSGTNLTSFAADFRLTQSSTAGAPKFLAGQVRFNTAVPLPSARIVNLSTRVYVGQGAAQAIAGFVFRDPSAVGKEALIRVLGPALVPGGVTGVLADPVGNLYAAGASAPFLTNDDWAEGIAVTSQAPVVQLDLEPPSGMESIILNRFSDGAYTTVVSGFDHGPGSQVGVALVELYDLEIGSAASLINVSTRGQVGTGGNVLIGGFVIQGPGTKSVIVRAIGPSLASAGVTGALQNPTLSLYNSAGQVIGQNDDYGQNNASDLAVIAAQNKTPSDSRESVLYKVLAPGAYTAIVRGVGNTTGVALVEIFDAD